MFHVLKSSYVVRNEWGEVEVTTAPTVRKGARAPQATEAASVFGWRARIALILPADNAVMEPELYGLGLDGVSFHALRITVTEHEQMRRQAVQLAQAAGELGADVVVYACAETSFDGGAATRQRLSSLVAECSGLPVVVATDAMIEAAAWLGLEQVALVTPYTAASGSLLEAALAARGIATVAAHHREFRLEGNDPREWYETNRQPSWVSYRMMRATDVPEADGVVVSATNLATLGTLEAAERDLGKPVVTCNQSILWSCLRTLGVSTAVPGLGRLLAGAR